MKRICICCGETMTRTGLNPNTCLDCDTMLELPERETDRAAEVSPGKRFDARCFHATSDDSPTKSQQAEPRPVETGFALNGVALSQ